MRASKLLLVLLSGFSIGLVVVAAPMGSAATTKGAPAQVGVVEPAGPDAVSAPGGEQQAPARSVTFVGATHSSTTASRHQIVVVPRGARPGDRAVMVFTHAAAMAWAGPTGTAGWAPIGSSTANGLRSTVYAKSLARSDLGAPVRFEAPARAKAMLSLAVYSGVSATAPVAAITHADRSTSRHVTPATSTRPGDLVLSYWVDHRDTTTSWSTSNATVRDTAVGAGKDRYGALLADSAAPRSAGRFRGRVGNSNAPTDAITWTVRLSAAASAAAPTPSPPAASVTKLLVIVEENESTQAYAEMPYLKSLSTQYGTATGYTGLVHPSLGNYLAMVSGQGVGTCGLRDPLPGPCPQPGPTVFGRALAAGHTATTYAESMITPCQATNSARYAARHNPWVYFTAEGSVCAAHDVPLGTTTAGALRSDIDAGALPNAGMIVPDLVNDAHDGTLGQADDWLHRWMPLIMAGPDYRAGRLAVVITFDEGTGANQNVPFVVVHPSVTGTVVTAGYTHYGLGRLYTDVLGLSPLGAGATEPGLRAAFGL